METAKNPVPREKLSRAPSWMMVGFAIGIMATLTVEREIDRRRGESESVEAAVREATAAEQRKAESEARAEARSALVLANQPSLSAIEAVFGQWGHYAIWQNETTQVALWNGATNEFGDNIEVVRLGSVLYYRTLPQLTRPLIKEGVVIQAPMAFTEPDRRAMREDAEARSSTGYTTPGDGVRDE